MSKAAVKQEGDTEPRYPVGTRFLHTVGGWGMTEGVVASYNGQQYTVDYPSMKIEDELVDVKTLDDATVTTNWNAHLLKVGQYVWAFMGKGKHPAVIQAIHPSAGMATVKWTASDSNGDVDLDKLFPMFDDDGEKPSRFSKRKKTQTNYFLNGKDESTANVFNKQELKHVCKEESRPQEDEADIKPKAKIESNYKIKHTKKRPGKKWNVGKAPRKRKILQTHLSPGKTIRQQSKDNLPGPGWEFNGNFWVSPTLGLKFTAFDACKFEAYRVELDGNEEEAYDKYKKYFGAPRSLKTDSLDKRLVKKEDDTNLLSPDKEEECNMLWEYYLNPKVRTNEELPSGMTIRKKIAQCSLLRSKCRFRHLVHKKILTLNVENKREEVYRILKQLHEHDVSGRSGDGPISLMEEILGSKATEIDEDVEPVQPISANGTIDAINIDELPTDNSTSLSSITESVPYASVGDDFNEDTKLSDLLRDDAYNVATPKKAFDKTVIDLLDDASTSAYDVTTPKKSDNDQTNQIVVDLVGEIEDEDVPAASPSDVIDLT